MPGNESVHYRQKSEEKLPSLPIEEVLRSWDDEGRLVETLHFALKNNCVISDMHLPLMQQFPKEYLFSDTNVAFKSYLTLSWEWNDCHV